MKNSSWLRRISLLAAAAVLLGSGISISEVSSTAHAVEAEVLDSTVNAPDAPKGVEISSSLTNETDAATPQSTLASSAYKYQVFRSKIQTNKVGFNWYGPYLTKGTHQVKGEAVNTGRGSHTKIWEGTLTR